MNKEEKMSCLRQNNGITLIALVVTIIVLIILAGISINLILGENGIIQKAQGAEIQTALANVREQYGFYLEDYYVDNVEQDVDVDKDRENFTDLLQKVYVGEGNKYVYAIKNLSKLNVTDNSGKGEIPERVEEITELNDVYIVDKDNEVSYIVDEKIYGKVETMVDLTVPTREDFFVIDEETGEITIAEDISENHDGIGYYYNDNDEKILSEENVVIPSTINGIEVKSIKGREYSNSGGFFRATNLKSVEIPGSVTEIDDSIFSGCINLEKVTILEGTKKIGNVFYNCINLKEITIPDSITTINSYALDDTAWYREQPDGVVYIGKVLYKYKGNMPENTTIQIKEGTKAIANYAFAGCDNLTNIIIPNSVTHIGESAFEGSDGLKNIVIPNSVMSIGDDTFRYCKGLEEITIEGNLIEMGSWAFSDCVNLLKVTMVGDIEVIGCKAFMNCSKLEEIKILSNLKRIEWEAFYNCSSLKSIVLPSSVTNIEEYAFVWCTNLTINCEASSKPSGWHMYWNRLDFSGNTGPVVWGYTAQ